MRSLAHWSVQQNGWHRDPHVTKFPYRLRGFTCYLLEYTATGLVFRRCSLPVCGKYMPLRIPRPSRSNEDTKSSNLLVEKQLRLKLVDFADSSNGKEPVLVVEAHISSCPSRG